MNGPALVLVHGAWHGPWCWDLLRAELPDVEVRAVALPSSGPDPAALGDLSDDAAAVRDAVASVGGPAVVVGHSYGGLPVTEACAGLPGVVRLVYLTAMLLDAGRSMASALRESWPDWWDVHADEGYVDALRVREMAYHDVAPAVADDAAARLGHQSLAALREPLTAGAWRDVPTTYVVCDRDRALVPAAQEKMARHADRVLRLHTGHSPFFAAPAAVADLLRGELAAVAC